MQRRKTILADDGSELELKDAVVVDKDGQPLTEEAASAAHVHVYRGGWIFMALLVIVIPLLLFAGFAVIGIFLTATVIVWALRKTASVLFHP